MDLVNVKEEYSLKLPNLKLEIFPSTVAWTVDEPVVFYLDTINDEHDFWGSSMYESASDVQNSGKVSVKLNGIDISSFILRNFLPRDYVLIKMDIEGAEYDIIPHMYHMSTHKLIDVLLVEVHPFILEEDKTKHNNTLDILKKMRASGVHIPSYSSPA